MFVVRPGQTKKAGHAGPPSPDIPHHFTDMAGTMLDVDAAHVPRVPLLRPCRPQRRPDGPASPQRADPCSAPDPARRSARVCLAISLAVLGATAILAHRWSPAAVALSAAPEVLPGRLRPAPVPAAHATPPLPEASVPRPPGVPHPPLKRPGLRGRPGPGPPSPPRPGMSHALQERLPVAVGGWACVLLGALAAALAGALRFRGRAPAHLPDGPQMMAMSAGNGDAHSPGGCPAGAERHRLGTATGWWCVMCGAACPQGCIGKGGRYPPPPSRAPSLCPATVPRTASAGFNGNRQ